MDDNQLITKAIEFYGLENENQLALRTGIPRNKIYDVRAGRKPLSKRERVQLYDVLGYAWAREAILALFPNELADHVKALDNERTKRRDGRKKTGQGS